MTADGSKRESSGVARAECKNPTPHKLAPLIRYVILSHDLNFKSGSVRGIDGR
jgi:hypothetical protein